VIEAVSKIGESVQKMNGEMDSLAAVLENPNSNGKYKHVLVVVLRESNGEYSFENVELQEFKSDFQIYLYKGKKGNSTDATPTCKITELNKTFKNKFLKWFDNCEDYDITNEEKETLKRIGKEINAQQNKILADLQEKLSGKKSGENAIITLGIEIDGYLKYLGNFQIFRSILLKKGCDRFYKKYGGESRGYNALCSACKEKKNEVYGFAIPWSFHTFDKPGFVAGGFDFSESWKNTPVCFECAMRLEIGKKYVEKNLDFGFYGFRYLLVPKMARGGDCTSVLKIFGSKESRDEQRNLKINRETRIQLTSDEGEILDRVRDQKDFLSNSLIFYKEDQSSYRILLLIEGILPSRLSKLFEAKKNVDDRFKIYRDNILTEAQKEKNPLEFNFGILRRFFPTVSRNRTFDKMFLEIVNKVFTGNCIDYYLLIDFIMRTIREDFIKGYSTKISTLNGFLFLHYIKQLGLFRETEEMEKMEEKGSRELGIEELVGHPLEQRIEIFFEANNSFFNSYAKKATFLEGALTQKLLNIQWMDKKATPFRMKLRGLKLNEYHVKKLLPDIQNKLEEYGKNYYRDLEKIIANCFVLSGVDWKEADDEISFYFVLGMDLHKIFKNEKEEEIEEVA